ncbi:MAG: radical SAM protein [Bacillota bacterium]|nr:radical SAM protein [Bacillota bacterium]
MLEVRLQGHRRFFAVQDLLQLFFGRAEILESENLVRVPQGPCLTLTSRVGEGEVSTLRPDGSGPRATQPEDSHFLGRLIRVQLYDVLARETGRHFPWGSLTGIRPTWLVTERRREGWSGLDIARELVHFYRVSPARARLALEVERTELSQLTALEPGDFILYIHIPFCPSRCGYCSFVTPAGVARPAAEHLAYVTALLEDMDHFFQSSLWRSFSAAGRRIRALYIGGGTPIALAPEALDLLVGWLQEHDLLLGGTLERTIEAGRPDFFSPTVLGRLRDAGFTRICINPQSFSDELLQAAGRPHGRRESEAAFAMARAAGFPEIHMDLIGGLPGSTGATVLADIRHALRLGPQSLTLHALAPKRGADWQDFVFQASGDLVQSFDAAYRLLRRSGYLPGPLYRQKRIMAGLENCTWALPGAGGLYNTAMLSDRVDVLGFGAGAMSKRVVAPGELRRLAAPREPGLYISRLAGHGQSRLALWETEL